jgi:hypothetical protein
VQFDCGIGMLPVRPGKKCQTQINQRSIKRITELRQIRLQGLVSIKTGGSPHQQLSDSGDGTPIPMLIGIGQIGSGQPRAEAGLINAIGSGVQTDDQIAQAFPTGELSKTQSQKMVVG